VKVTLYTDPGCPFGVNAQRQELQLMWLSPEAMAAGRTRMREQYGTPMGSETVTEVPATIDACRAYVGARLHEPDRALALLRALRRRAHSDQQRLDDPATLHAAAEDAGIAPDRIDAWLADEAVEAALRADMAATRDPLPEALAWAPFALATAEVAELRGTSRDQARDELERAGATFTPSANDGYWAAG
jgi:protein-disulfide isomerase-like protein with CxxC motif